MIALLKQKRDANRFPEIDGLWPCLSFNYWGMPMELSNPCKSSHSVLNNTIIISVSLSMKFGSTELRNETNFQVCIFRCCLDVTLYHEGIFQRQKLVSGYFSSYRRSKAFPFFADWAYWLEAGLDCFCSSLPRVLKWARGNGRVSRDSWTSLAAMIFYHLSFLDCFSQSIVK